VRELGRGCRGRTDFSCTEASEQWARAIELQVVAREARRTPGRLWVALGAIWLLTLLTYLVARNGLIDARTSAQTIGRNDEPNVVNARQIASSLTDMHAHVANAFLLGFGEHSDDWDVYERQRQTVASTLALVQQNNTAPEASATARQVAQDYGLYQDRTARAAENQAQNFPVGMSYFREANDLIQRQLLPAVDQLARSGDSSLKATFAGRVSGSGSTTSGVVIIGLLLLVTLVATIGQLIDANQSDFDARIQQVPDDLGGPLGAETLLPITALLIAALAWFGLQPRISEYR
jgi:hypothetical protein